MDAVERIDLSRRVAEHLQGQCVDGVRDALEAVGGDPALAANVSFCEMVDQLVFECDACGWWAPESERRKREAATVCDDCATEDGDGDDEDGEW